MEHLAWWVAEVAKIPLADSRLYISEIDGNLEVESHVRRRTLESDRRGLADSEVRLGRRIGWYALVRALKPQHIVETGTDKGLGSVVLAEALIANGFGALTTLDINADAGYLIDSARYRSITTIVREDSLGAISRLDLPVDFFIHDSSHSFEHESAEYVAIAPLLTDSAAVLSDNSDVTNALVEWAEACGRSFSYFQERPVNHWYPGGGVGISFART